MTSKALTLTLLLPVILSALLVTPVNADPFLVVPGRSLGQMHLGLRGGVDLKRLPEPDGEDAAMGGRRTEFWKSKKSPDTLGVEGMTQSVLDPPQPGFRVDEIRATSPLFHTAKGVSPGATLAQIKRGYPQGHLDSTGEPSSSFYMVRQGIAFEFPAHPAGFTRSVAVFIFPQGASPNMTALDELSNK